MTWHRFSISGQRPLHLEVDWKGRRPQSQIVLPRWFLWMIIGAAMALAWFGCQQPFLPAQGVKTCPTGYHVEWSKNGQRCIQNTPSPDSTP